MTYNTTPQRILNNLLDDMGIKYTNEKNFKYYSVDDYLNDYHLVIEVMGDFWHASPLKYTKDTLREIQINRIPKDKAKRTYIKNKHNINILYLWESDLHKSLEVCRELIEQYIKNNGILDNYNSFNYSIINNKLMMNDEIIYPFYEQ